MIKPQSAYRYAVYFAPEPDSTWWTAGSQWLGRCALTDQVLVQPSVAGISAELFAQLTEAPRRYGWHATLKAPFELAQHCDYAQLSAATAKLASQLAPVNTLTLKLAVLDDFIALIPDPEMQAINSIASACVRELHNFAKPLSEAELARRRAAKLSPEQEVLMLRWGYPYVMDQFRFHLSLTGSLKVLTSAQIELVVTAAQDFFAKQSPQSFNGIALFAEPEKGAAFKLIDYFKLG